MSRRVEQKAQRREMIAAQLAAQKKAEQRRRLLLAVGAVVVVIVIVAGLVTIRLVGGGKKTATGPTGAADASIVSAISSVPEATYNSVGAGTIQATPAPITGDPLTADGKPKVLYIGAEFCPYCAFERWPVTVAMSRFGKFTGLGTTHSASADVFPNTPTLSFHGATYTSQYLSFTGVETTTNEPDGSGYKPLDTPSAEDAATEKKYNAPPYVKEGGSIPFVDLGGKFVVSGATNTPQVLAGKTQAQIADALKDANSPISKAVLGSANVYTAALCQLTNNQPSNVCSLPGVTSAAAKLGKS
jgi:hypothetical protein